MKSLFLSVLTGFLFTSCVTKDVTAPKPTSTTDVFFKDQNVTVENMQVVPSGNTQLTVSFSTGYENNIQEIDVMSGGSSNNFCTVETFSVSRSSASEKNYSFIDTNIKGNTMYYMLRIKDNTGNYSYTPYCTVNL